MMHRLVYVCGPSGAGKDSLLGWLTQRLRHLPAIHWAQRTIDRPVQCGGEAHEAVSSADFDRLHATDEFAMAWHANGLNYGIRRSQLGPLAHGAWVFVNGSRGHLSEAQRAFPGLTVVHVTVEAGLLRQRLLARGRETHEKIDDRLARAAAFKVPPGALEVVNDGTLDEAGLHLLHALESLPGWPIK